MRFGDLDRLLDLDLNVGDLIFIGGLFAMGLYTPLVRRLHRDEPAAVMAFWTLVTGTFWLLLVNNWAIFETDWGSIDFEVFAGIAYLAVFTTIISFFIQQHATLYLGPTRVMSYGYLNPALVVAVEWFLGKGLPTLATLPGVLIIVVATFVVQGGIARESGGAKSSS